jgi:hypothetical protein
METKQMSRAAIQGKLSRAEMKYIMAGTSTVDGIDGEDELKPICTACTSDSQCAIKVCRSSPSCPNDEKVSPRLLYC